MNVVGFFARMFSLSKTRWYRRRFFTKEDLETAKKEGKELFDYFNSEKLK